MMDLNTAPQTIGCWQEIAIAAIWLLAAAAAAAVCGRKVPVLRAMPEPRRLIAAILTALAREQQAICLKV